MWQGTSSSNSTRKTLTNQDLLKLKMTDWSGQLLWLFPKLDVLESEKKEISWIEQLYASTMNIGCH